MIDLVTETRDHQIVLIIVQNEPWDGREQPDLKEKPARTLAGF
jgi:hypothetical protein